MQKERLIYTGIGSRETPKDVLKVMRTLAFQLASRGWKLRSGGAQGADQAFEEGWWDYRMTRDACFTADDYECYIPWANFEEHTSTSHDGKCILPSDIPVTNERKAYQIASEIHPAWEVCKQGAKLLHTRNVYQILGWTVDKPSKMVVAYARVDKNGRAQGGTATAIHLAEREGVEVFNLYKPEARERIETWLKTLTR